MFLESKINYDPIYLPSGIVDFGSIENAKDLSMKAIGRILRMGSRPSQDGDIETYETLKRIITDASEYIEIKEKINGN